MEYFITELAKRLFLIGCRVINNDDPNLKEKLKSLDEKQLLKLNDILECYGYQINYNDLDEVFVIY